MAFQVRWLAAAEQALTRIWIADDDRQAIADAADVIDQQLRTDPTNLGESREGAMRLTIVYPLSVVFEVFGDDRRVEVTSVSRMRKRS